MKCVSACPRRNVKLTLARKEVAPLIVSVAAAFLIGLYYFGNLGVSTFANSYNQSITTETLSDSDTAGASAASAPSESQNTEAATASPSSTVAPTTPSSSSSGYADGTYTGSGTGFHNGTTTVSVTISGGEITDIQTISSQDDGPYYNRAFPTISSEIISEQSSSVDAVSGATFSSKGIMDAVADALSQAK
ncbi:MAG: FMN-binding protein [Oscillospiraceae bacterium]|nr:FMN-binding protein [Oscillospiraceae bacterium]